MIKSVVIIPARYKSSRFPGKPLATLLGKPMILWVCELCANAVGAGFVYVATEDTRIYDLVQSEGFQAIMTSEDALTGTDRVAEAADLVNADIYINVQGDEPLIDPGDIIKVRDKKIENIESVINAYAWMSNQEDQNSINIPKVITNETGQLVYISRAALPGFKDKLNAPKKYKKQVCIYAFTKEELVLFKNFNRKSQLENCEDIEILRFFELNKSVLMVEAQGGSLAVDIPDDVLVVESVLSKKNI